MKNETSNIANVETSKKATSKKATSKKIKLVEKKSINVDEVEKTETLKVTKKIAKKIATENKTQKLFSTLSKISGLSIVELKFSLIKILSNKKQKVNLNEFLTQLILKVADGNSITKETENSIILEFTNELAIQNDFDIEKLQGFLINSMATNSKSVSLKLFFKDLFWKIGTNQKDIKTKINEFSKF